MIQVLVISQRKFFSIFSQWQNRCSNELEKGLNLANFLRIFIQRTLDLHESNAKPLDKTSAEHLGHLICLLKAVHSTFILNQSQISRNLPSSIESVYKTLISKLKHVGKGMKNRSFRSVREIGSHLNRLAIHCALHFSSEFSQICTKVISDIFGSKSLVNLGFTRNEIFPSLRNLSLLLNYNKNVDDVCDVSFLVHSRDNFGLFLKYIHSEPPRILFLASAMNDIGQLFPNKQQIETYFVDLIRKEFILPILALIETELRFHCHQHLQVSERNPFKITYNSFDKFLSITPFRILTRFIDVQFEASYYFSRIYYNETAVSPQVWETYTEMANLAERLYRIQVLDCHLPGEMAQQEIDVLEIMRNINKFVQFYNYDLNSQVFIQRAEDSHHIAIIGIPHIFSSYRCHGIGIMNTTVDFIYKFLKAKFNVFHQLMFDSFMRGTLLSEKTWFDGNKESVGALYPYERADKILNDMRRMNRSDSQTSILDTVRILITEIGNALGFVRMVKSGGTRFMNNSIGFVYDEDLEFSFKNLLDEGNPLLPHTMESTERLDSVVTRLKELFQNSESFFSILIQVFESVLRPLEHCKLFYILIPPLTLCFVQHISALKDTSLKQNKNSSFSDDGFPMGLAYILRLLDQDSLFDSLHWFDSLKKQAQIERTEAQASTSKKIALDRQKTVKLLLQMIDRKISEYTLLETTVHSARILFH